MVPTHDGYWGVDGTRSHIAFGIAVAVPAVVILLGVFTASRPIGFLADAVHSLRLTSASPPAANVLGTFGPIAALVFAVGGTMAALNAYWNDGLAASWALAVGVAASLFWPVLALMALGAAWGVAAGTVGYALGRAFRLWRADARWDDLDNPLLWRLLGLHPGQTISWGLVAAVLTLVAFAITSTRLPHLADPETRTFLVIGVGAVLATVAVYANGGLLVGWAAAFAPVFGAGVATTAEPTLPGTLLSAFLGATLLAVVVGTVCYTLGTNLRRFFPPQYLDPPPSRA